MTANLSELPKDLPRPVDDGAASHLQGMKLPEVALRATDGTTVNVGAIPGRVVIYVYPMTGRPGAKHGTGCTCPSSC